MFSDRVPSKVSDHDHFSTLLRSFPVNKQQKRRKEEEEEEDFSYFDVEQADVKDQYTDTRIEYQGPH